MTTRTRIIILLVVVTVLYLASLGSGLFRQDGPSGVDAGGGLGSLAALRSWFAPRLNVSVLPKCNGQRVDSEFELSEDKSFCSIRIPRDSSEDYRVADIKVHTANVPIYVFAEYEDEKDFAKKDRNTSTCKLEDESRATFRVQITYPEPKCLGQKCPEPKCRGKWCCWIKQSVSANRDGVRSIPMTFMKNGGDLMLECIGCRKQARKTVRLEMD